MRKLLAGFLILFLGLAAQTAAGPLSERILFVSAPQGIPKIYKIRPDGKDLSRLTRRAGPEWEPDLAASNGRVVFRGLEDGHEELFTVSLQGRDVRRLTRSAASERSPSWGPEARRVLFSTDRWGVPELAILDLDSETTQRLTHDQSINLSPTWSPDGESVAFVTYRHGLADVYIMKLADRSLRRVTEPDRSDVAPRWSPDSRFLVYQSQVGPKDVPQLKLFDTESGESRVVAEAALDPRFPSWAPDGQSILFTSGEPGKRQLQTYRLDDQKVYDFPVRGFLPPMHTCWSRIPFR